MGKPKDVRERFAEIGIGERTEQLTVALVAMLASYDRLLVQLPAGSVARALVEGSFGKVPDVARKLTAPSTRNRIKALKHRESA